MDLQGIIEGCVSKDAKCQKLLYERYYGYAFKIAFRYIYHYQRAADVVNDGFVKILRSIGSFVIRVEGNAEPQLMAWIKKIVINTAIDDLRRYHLMPEAVSIPEHIWNETRHSQNADDLLLFKELICHVKSLPPVYGAVFNMHVIDGFSHHEIAEQLGISVGTSKSNLFKAKTYLQKLISKEVAYSNL